jgi:hypothetical protein
MITFIIFILSFTTILVYKSDKKKNKQRIKKEYQKTRNLINYENKF